MSNNDFKVNKVAKTQARKLIAEIVNRYPGNVYFSVHAQEEMEKDDLTTVDIWNVLTSPDAIVIDEGELINGSYRYRLETRFIMAVVAFHTKGDGFNIVTVWDKRIKE